MRMPFSHTLTALGVVHPLASERRRLRSLIQIVETGRNRSVMFVYFGVMPMALVDETRNKSTKEKGPCQTVNIGKTTSQVKVFKKLSLCSLKGIKKLCSQGVNDKVKSIF